MADTESTLAVLRSASGSGGMAQFDWAKAAKPLLIGTLAGGITLVFSDWLVGDMFVTNGVDDEGAWWKRPLVKMAIGLAGFLVLRKASLAAAIGVGIGGFVGGMKDLLVAPEGPFKLDQKLDEWTDDTNTTNTNTNTNTTNTNTNTTNTSASAPRGGLKARNVLVMAA